MMTNLITKRYQVVNWFPEWRGFYVFRWHKDGKRFSMADIYDWFLGIAFWEIRKWHKPEKAIKNGEFDHIINKHKKLDQEKR